MIPKIIHYCWFGKGKMPELATKCIKSWNKFLPDYKLMIWNEDTFDVSINSYTQEAYAARKFAFVTDYVRLYALYNYGGIYMDTDVEVLKNLDNFLNLPAFSGFENDTQIPTGIMASEKGGEWVKYLLSYYDDKHFIKNDGTLDLTTNVKIICDMMNDGTFIFSNSYQNYKNIVHIFPKDYFCPKSHKTGKINLTPNSYTIHHFAGSWRNKSDIIKHKISKIIGIRFTMYIVEIIKKIKHIFK